VTGDGAGPTAVFLNPYPRDYRRGTFKFKSTPRQSKPTHEDLRSILINGIPDTAMPSFRTLPSNELEALIHYVRYLSIRGETERSLVQYALLELEPADEEKNIAEERLFNIESPTRGPRAAEIREYVTPIVQKWLDAESEATPVAPPSWLADGAELSHEREVELLKHGRELFYGKVAACVKCHGNAAIGDGQTTDYDDWTKELEPTVPEALDEYLALGRSVFPPRGSFVFPPRNIQPRNLRMGHYRGGRRPVDIYLRILNGIDGTPMPALSAVLKKEGEQKIGVTHDDIWALVYYVRSLPYESISQPAVAEAAYQRERQ
jgi:mono/diheme cytochrome c family protein